MLFPLTLVGPTAVFPSKESQSTWREILATITVIDKVSVSIVSQVSVSIVSQVGWKLADVVSLQKRGVFDLD